MKRGIGKERYWTVIWLLTAFGLLAGACFGRNEKGWTNATLAAALRNAPDAAQRLKNPFHSQATAISAGRKLFGQYCAQCHGKNAEGSGSAPPLRSMTIHQAPDGVLFWFLKNGKLRAGMPSWSGLPSHQRWQIVSFLKSLQP